MFGKIEAGQEQFLRWGLRPGVLLLVGVPREKGELNRWG